MSFDFYYYSLFISINPFEQWNDSNNFSNFESKFCLSDLRNEHYGYLPFLLIIYDVFSASDVVSTVLFAPGLLLDDDSSSI